jgi:hypothetical protein
LSIQRSSPPTTDDRAGEVGLAPVVGSDRLNTGLPRSLPRHLAPSQRRPGLVRSVLSAGLLMVVVLAVGAVVIFSSIDRLKHPPPAGDAVGSPGSTQVQPQTAQPGEATRASLLREGSFEAGMGAVRRQKGTRAELIAGVGAGSAHSVRLSNAGQPVGSAGLLADRVAKPPRMGSVYVGTVQVKATRPGKLIQLRLIESFAGQRVSATAGSIVVKDTGWHQVGAEYVIKTEGAVLGVEVTIKGLDPGEFVWVDNLTIAQTR